MAEDSDPTQGHDELPTLVRRGTAVVLAAQIASQVVSLAALAMLARLVAPEAFGVMGVALPLVILPRMTATLGFSAAAIQDPRGDHDLLSALFWRVAGWSILAAVVTAAAGVLASRTYALPDLETVTLALATATLLNALSVVPLALLERRLELPTAALLRLAAQSTAAAVAVAAAWRGWGVWSLVLQHVVELALLAPTAWLASRWWPRLHFALPHEVRKFGGYYAISSLLFYAAQNVDKLLLAAWLGSSSTGQALLGMYAQAYNLAMRPVSLLTTPLSTVAFPTLSRVQHDAAARAHYTERFHTVTALLLLPAGVGLWLTAHDVMYLVAPKWPEAGDFLAALAPLVVAQGFINLGGGMLASARRGDLLLLAAAVQLVLLAQGVWGGASFAASDYQFTTDRFDPATADYRAVLGAAYGVSLVTTLVLCVPYMWFVFSATGVPLARFFAALRVALPAALVMGVAVYVTRQWLLMSGIPAWSRLAICIALGVAVYAAMSYRSWRSMQPEAA